MVETITPVVYGGRSGWARGFGLHVAGATITAAFFGAAVGWIGGLLGAPFGRPGLVVVAIAALVYAAGAAGLVKVPVPQLRRQVPDWWRTYFSPSVAAFLYGAGLGIGFLTFLGTGALVVVTLAAALSGSALAGMVLLGAFGLARGLSAWIGGTVHTPEEGGMLVGTLSDRSDVARRAVAAVLLGLVLAAAIAAVPSAAPPDVGSLAAAALAVVFAWAAAAKLVAPRRWRATLAGYELPAGVERAARPGVPTAEGLVVALVLLGAPRLAAAWAIVMIVVFAAASVRAATRRGGSVACGCFGARKERPLGWVLARDAALTALAVTAAAGATDSPRWPSTPGPGEVLPAVLALAGLVVTASALWLTASALRREIA